MNEEAVPAPNWLRGVVLPLVICCAIAYAPFAVASLFWDDHLVIRPDGPISSLGTLRRTFTGRCVLFPPQITYDYYRPLIDSLFVLEYALAGQRPLLYHLTNFLLHVANVVMAVRLLRELLGESVSRYAALMGLAIFSVHPLQSESVLWVAARPGVLSLFFSLIALLLLAKLRDWRGIKGVAGAAGVAVAFTAALLSKETALALPVSLLPLVLNRNLTKAPRSLHLAGLLLAIIAVGYFLLNPVGGGALQRNLESLGVVEFARLLLQAYGFYVWSFFVPFSLIPNYPVGIDQGPWHLALGVLGAVGSLGAVVRCLVRRDSVALIVASALLYMGSTSLLPLFGGQFQLADRYLYQALLGLGVAVACGAARLEVLFPRARDLMPRAVNLLIVALVTLALVQSCFWVREELMWARVLRVDPDNIAGNLEMANRALALGNRQAGVEHLQRAVHSPQTMYDRQRNIRALELARMLMEDGRFEEALVSADIAAREPSLGAQPLVLKAMIYYLHGNRARGRELVAKFRDDDQQDWTVYTNLAIIARRFEKDEVAAARWTAKAREKGAAKGDLSNSVNPPHQ